MSRFRRRVRAFARLVLREHATPRRIALAVLVGCVVGTSPLFGLHLPICVLLSLLFRLNRVVVYGVANLSVPPMIPVLGLVSVDLGERIRHGEAVGLTRADFAGDLHEVVARFSLSWLVGGLALGLVLGAAGAIATYAILRRRAARYVQQGGEAPEAPLDPYSLSPERQFGPRIGAAIKRASRRYRIHARPLYFAGYALAKYRLDPCYGALASLVPPGARVVDLGTGLGMLPVVLAELGEGRTSVGVEWDRAKACCAERVARPLDGVKIVTGDVRLAEIPACDVVVLADVLHYLDEKDQRDLLVRAAAALSPGGRILVREVDSSRRGWARWTRGLERSVVRLGWNRGRSVAFRSIAALRSDLRALGFAVVRESLAGPLHPGNVLLTAERSGVLAFPPDADRGAPTPGLLSRPANR